jgi:hypothetical protein
MEQKIKNIELIKNLPEDSLNEIICKNNQLKEKAGAVFEIESVTPESVQVNVKNINGKRYSKYELFTHTYSAFSKNLPPNYRLLIKL